MPHKNLVAPAIFKVLTEFLLELWFYAGTMENRPTFGHFLQIRTLGPAPPLNRFCPPENGLIGSLGPHIEFVTHVSVLYYRIEPNFWYLGWAIRTFSARYDGRSTYVNNFYKTVFCGIEPIVDSCAPIFSRFLGSDKSKHCFFLLTFYTLSNSQHFFLESSDKRNTMLLFNPSEKWKTL